MSHAFISYRGEDLERVGLIARALEKAGVDVWWDRGLPNGESWHATIEEKLASAGCAGRPAVVGGSVEGGQQGALRLSLHAT